MRKNLSVVMLGLAAVVSANQALANGPCCLPDGSCVLVRLIEDCTVLGGTVGIGGQTCEQTICAGGPACGDGIVNGTEQCDDGNDVNTDGCRNTCTLPFCGDGLVDANEACDDGNAVNTDECRNNCTLPYCGDGIIDSPVEQCDDGNTVDADECHNDCTLGFCGDGLLQLGEECDDGNLVDGDGCSAVCDVEASGGGCTPGYWKQTQHFDSWVGYLPTDRFDTVFSVTLFGNKTLLQVLGQGGGGRAAMGRHAVAALLSASSGGVDYFYSVAEVINLVQGAVATGTFEAAHLILAAQNELGCPLN